MNSSLLEDDFMFNPPLDSYFLILFILSFCVASSRLAPLVAYSHVCFFRACSNRGEGKGTAGKVRESLYPRFFFGMCEGKEE